MLLNSFLISSSKTEKQLIQGTALGGNRILGEGGSRYRLLNVVPCSHLLRKISKSTSSEIGNLHAILRPSERVTISQFFQWGILTEAP